MADTTTRKLGRYEVVRELAEGGMGVVYLATQPSLERQVVLKRMRRDVAGDAEAEARFRREALTPAAIHHPNVVGVYDCFTYRSEPYIVCEYVDGLDAASVLAKAGPLPPRIAALLALEIVRGLEELHARGLVHRDLKPDNVLVGRGGEVKIADFGIAHDPRSPSLTRTGVSLGTPAYMSPEQLRGERVDPRSDVFALGVVLYELLSGTLPFAAPDADDEEGEPSLLRRIERGQRASLRRAAPGTPLALVRIVHRCLRAAPKRRFATTARLRERLERHLGVSPPAETRREIADWLAERKVLPARGRTRRQTAEPEGGLRLGPWALAAAMAGLLLALALVLPAGLRTAPDWTLARHWLDRAADPAPAGGAEPAAGPLPPPADFATSPARAAQGPSEDGLGR
ncbi:MAG: serine/threonine-protein kinase [Myxococcota bacterium]